MSQQESSFLQHEPCLACGSTDANSRYTDNHTYCFNCNNHVHGDSSAPVPYKAPKMIDLIPNGEYKALPSRGLKEETLKKMRYSVGTYSGQAAQIVNIPNQDGEVVAQKIRLPGKVFKTLGDSKSMGMVFQNIWPAGGLKLIITEGELDALSVSQAQGNKYPVISLPNGSSNLKPVTASYDYINSFDEIVIMFDMDAPGKEAAIKVASMFGPKARIARLIHKDANEELLKEGAQAIVKAIWNAEPYRPDGVITLSSIKEKLKAPVTYGLPWIYPKLTKLTYGRRPGELIFIGAGSGIGKTDFLMQQASADIMFGHSVAMFFLESSVVDTGKRLAGKYAKKRFHVPDAGWTADELDNAVDDLTGQAGVFLYDHWGSKDWDTIRDNIRFLATTSDVKHVYVDHLTALVAHAVDERREIERITAEMASLAEELHIYLYVVSHLATPEGAPHEEGGQVRAKHFKGSRSIIYWAHFMFGLERNTQAEDIDERHTTTFRILKDRYTGQSTGETFALGYSVDEGTLYEQEDQQDDNPFDTGEDSF